MEGPPEVHGDGDGNGDGDDGVSLGTGGLLGMLSYYCRAPT